ncbi:MAG: Flp pilus assembly protein TadD [Devosia litorisediminis]|jgi:Flp pilus assembly protein TadD
MSTASTSTPKPKNWQDFERQIETLAQCWLRDPNAQGNARQGQPQNGVDVYGRREKAGWVGLQCKQKMEKAVTATELRDEVNKAAGFEPKLSEFILVTTAPRDGKIQEVARQITDDRDDFSVHVWGWEDVEGLVARFPEARRIFDPDYSPIISEEIDDFRIETNDRFDELLAAIKSSGSSVGAAPAPESEKDESTERHGQISLIQSLIDEGDVSTAIPLLQRFEDTQLEAATASEIYRFKVAQANIEIKRERFDDAGSLLMEAAGVHPEHKNASSNMAIGHLLTGNGEKAEELASDVLASDPTNQNMADTLAQARAQQDKPDVFENIPGNLLNSSVIWGLKCSLARMANDDAWRTIARDGLAEHVDDKFLKRFAAEATVDECVSEAPAFIAGEKGAKISWSDLDGAAHELAAQIEALKAINGEIPAAMAHNAALACRLVGRFDEALAILTAAIVDHPDEHAMVEQVAMHHVHHGEAKEAITLLADAERSLGGSLTLAAAYIDVGRFDDAKSLLDEQAYPSDGEVSPFQFLGVHFEWFRKQKRAREATEFFADLCSEMPNEILPLLFHAKTARLDGDDDTHHNAIESALTLVDENTPFTVAHELADEAFRGRLYDVTVELLKDRVATDHENEPLSLCIAAAMNGDLHRTASDLLAQVPDEVANERWYRRVKIALENRIGSGRALPMLNAFLADFPDDAEMRTARIGLWQTSGQSGKIKKDVESTDFDGLSGSPFSLMQFYRVATIYSDGSKSVPRAYQLLLENWNNVDCHTGYQSIFLTNEKIDGIDRAPLKIGLDCAFRVRTGKGEERTHRIEETQPAVFGDEWLAPDGELAAAFYGKSVGDTVEMSGAFQTTTIDVLEVKSIYLDVLHRSMAHFQDRFPSSGAMFQMTVDTEADDPFVEMKQMTRRMAERDEELLNAYRDNPIPIVWLAGLLRKDEIECSIGLPAEMNIPFRICQGLREERELAFSTIANNGKRGVVVDAVTAVLIKRLGVEEAVEAVCGPIKTASTTIERLTERYHEAESMIGRMMGTFGYRDGQYILTEHTEEHQQNILKARADELEWARTHLEVLPSLPQTELDKEAKVVADLVGIRAIAPSLAASGADLPLLADDFGIRIWSKAALDVDGLWLQPVLMKARDGEHLSDEQYAEAVLAMVDAGFSYVSLDSRTLFQGLKKANFNVDALSKPLKMLLGKSADINNNLLIAIAVMVALKDEDCPPITVYRLASEVARAAVYPRWAEANAILSAIASAPVPALREHLQNWLYWNSMGSKRGS